MPEALWIGPREAPPDRVVQRPAYHLVGELSVPGPVRRAELLCTAHGVFEVFVNGTRAGHAELLPGFTAYRKRLPVHTLDVSELVSEGRVALGFLLSDGWWRGQGGGTTRLANAYGDTTAMRAELVVELVTGERVVLRTDENWLSHPSHVTAADLIAGEVHDLRRSIDGWAEVGKDRSAWAPVVVQDHPIDILVPATGPLVRRVQELPAISVTELGPGRAVVDFGQNSNGWIRLDDLGPAGTTITLTYGERLDQHGDVTQEGIAASAPERGIPFQTDVVTSAGAGSSFEPRHSTKGFRYVRVEGHVGRLDARSITSVVVHSDLRPLGGFSCSNARLNKLHDAAVWSFRTNVCDIPTDCPQRERAGWTGDWQVFVATAAYLYDVHDFCERWLADLRAEQWDDGTVTNMVPDQHDFDLPEHARWRFAQGSSGWGDAACHVPWEVYRAYGRTQVLRAQFNSMRRWVDWAAARAASGRHPSREAVRPKAAEHERYIWDTGFHFGEWTEPDATGDVLSQILVMDHGPTATAFLHRSARELADTAEVLGDARAAEAYSDLAGEVRRAWQFEFIDADGHVQPRRQANLVRALAFNLVPDELRRTAVEDLVELIRDAGTHLGTGFLATPFLLPVLADNGRVDIAYELLLQDTPPSWLHMVDSGATTIWEAWSDRASQNHYSKGAVISFLHHYVAGLTSLEPGYRKVRIQPRPGGGLTRASTFHVSPQGRLEVSWEVDGETGRLEVKIPENTTADLVLPDGSSESVGPGTYQRVWQAQS